jgi:hypothetical protein
MPKNRIMKRNMNTHSSRRSAAKTPKIQLVVLGLLCMMSAFAIGSQTSGSVRTVGSTEALGGRLPGDVDGDELVTVADAIVILEVANGYREHTAKELLGDPNADGKLTIDDALRILRDVPVTTAL